MFHEELFSKASQSVCQALTQFMSHEVALGAYALGKLYQYPQSWRDAYTHQKEGYWLQTNLKGELMGSSFLWVSEEDAQQLMGQLPITEASPEANKELLISFLLELDNILSAHFIKFWAEQAQLNVYGDVPAFHHQIPALLYSFIHQEQLPNTQNWFYLELVIKSLNIRFEFTWFFEELEN